MAEKRDCPPLKIYEFSRTGIRTVDGPTSFEEDSQGIRIEESVDLLHQSEDGEYIAVYVAGTLSIYQTSTGALVSSIQHPKIKFLSFSPNNTFIQSWQYVEKLQNPNDKQPDNLIIWDVATGERVHSWLEKHYSTSNWPFIKWTADETVAAKMSNGKVNFYAGKHFNVIVNTFKLQGVARFSWAPSTTIPHKFAVFVPEKKGQPGKVQVCEYPETSNIIIQKSIFKAQSADILWNKQGTAALLISQTDIDTSGKSYYGETGVHLLNAKTGECKNVRPSLVKPGPIYECVWSPKGAKFVVVYGSMPSKTTLFNLNLERLMDFPEAHRNTAIFCPHGHTLAIAGFGNLQGETDIWDVQRGRLISKMKAPCTTECIWSPCSTYILTSTLTPRLRQDNGWKIWKPNGELVYHHPVGELYRVVWRNVSAQRYPNNPPRKEDSAPAKQVEQTAAATKTSVYRPPHARNKPVEEPKAEIAAVAQKYKPKSQQPKTVTPIGELSKSAQKNKRRRQKKKQKLAETENTGDKKEEEESSSNTTEDKKEQSSVVDNEEKIQKQKRAKTLKKKLRQIELLKEKQSEGKQLNNQELQKLKTEASLRKELTDLSK